jgi:3-hydroxyisobutyrate dehydrogenase-like beta-hydroxyacid dehydrogenase
MSDSTVGLLHPGEMGAAVGAELRARGTRVVWATRDRSPATAQRAAAAGLEAVDTPRALAEESDVILSICPPGAAFEVARSVGSYAGVYVDANAISPVLTHEIAALLTSGGARYVDGGIIGPPPSAHPSSRATRLYLAGADATRVAALFTGSGVDARVIASEPGAASALKMSFAAWTKGTEALLLATRALARAEGVEVRLVDEWDRMGLVERSVASARTVSTKGWRWVDEMEQIAATFAAHDLPDGFHAAAAEVFRRVGRDDDAAADPETLDRVLAELARLPLE